MDLTRPTSIASTGGNLGPVPILQEVQAVLDERLSGNGEVDATGAEYERAAAELLRSRIYHTVGSTGRTAIRLRHLHVYALKRLRDVELWFPERGSILIKGQNEAGKSTLFEAIYFGLYGAPLIGEEARATLDDLIPHDGSPAGVDISISIGEAILEVHRTLLRGGTAQPVDHGAQLRVHRPQAPLEEITGPEAVNERLLREMNGLSGDTLRNSCFLEQKGLDRVERLAGDQRDTSAANERLTNIEKELVTAADRAKQDVDQHRRAYEVATLRQAAGDAELLAASAHEQLHAARVRLLLEERDSRDTARERQEEHIAMLNLRTQLAAEDAAIQAQDERIGTLRQLVEAEAALSARLGEQVVELLTLYAPANRMYYGTEAFDKLVSDWPLLANVDGAKLDNYEELYRTASKEAHHLRQSANSRAHSYGLLEAELEVETCRQGLAESERERHRFELAAEMAEQMRGRILRRILPQTMAYMQQLLPELTDGRYREVELTVQEGTELSANLGIRLWDEEAGRHVAKNLFSDGTRDQCSLALRLAYALATLSKGLGAVPGFIFLDEPLSSFDADRSQALVPILTEGIIAQQFDQVVLISRSQTIDQDSFRYYVRLENGRVSDSNLPSIPTTPIPTYP